MNLPVLDETSPAAPWYKDGLKFQCTCSGNCCTGGPGYVWMSDEEIDRLAAHLKLDREATVRRYMRKVAGGISLKEHKTEGGLYDCIFLTTLTERRAGKGAQGGGMKRVCGIYEARPLQCRTWPFWDGVLASKESWTHTAQKCPGMNRGKHYTLEQIEPLRTAEDWPDTDETPGSK